MYERCVPGAGVARRTIRLLTTPVSAIPLPDGDEISIDAEALSRAASALDSLAEAASLFEEAGMGAEPLVRLLADFADLVQGGPFPEGF